MRSNLALMTAVVLALLGTAMAEDSNNPEAPRAVTQLIEEIRPSVVTIRVSGRDGGELAMGTGFVIDREGLIATNLHVIPEGRSFSIETPDGRELEVASIESTDRAADLAIIRVRTPSPPIAALPLAEEPISQGTNVVAFGNPLGLRDSVVTGIVSAVREVGGREMIQLAMPTQPGNSGGPLVDRRGRVRGIINMKSAVDDNLGFAIPIQALAAVRSRPNPVAYDRWVTLGTIDSSSWTTLFGATWQQRGGIISARGLGNGFGGRALCLSKQEPLPLPMEVAVDVRFADESGAAGLVFHSDGQDLHYGFYPSNGRLRLSCFKGPSVYSWQVLEEVESEHYLPGRWNRLRVRIEKDRLRCYVNEHLVIESRDQHLTSGQLGLAKFRNTSPDFKAFRIGADLAAESLTEKLSELMEQVVEAPWPTEAATSRVVRELGQSSDAVTRELEKRAVELEQRAQQIRRVAVDVKLAPITDELEKLAEKPAQDDEMLFRGALLIAKLDNDDIDVDAYVARVESMSQAILDGLEEDADPNERRQALHQYLFDENGYHGGRAEYYHRANSYLDRVIDDREGLPITLSILYMELARRIGMDVQGVGLPGHFVVRHMFGDTHQFVDVFDRGALLSDDDVDEIVRSYAGRLVSEADLREQTATQIWTRVLNNLIGVASRESDLEAIHRYCEALVAIQPDSAQSRMLRSQARALTKRTTAAIEDLDWLIERTPPGFDPVQVLQLRDNLIERTERE
jgi:regulator of sirC expression with transglutaminase-like and TPR domain